MVVNMLPSLRVFRVSESSESPSLPSLVEHESSKLGAGMLTRKDRDFREEGGK